MLKTRVIPCLLTQSGGLVKTVRFKEPKYLGDPINIVKIFNDKEVDEIILLDIRATLNNKRPDVDFISKIAGECFMPLCYGGGIRTIADIKDILNAGVEKVAINTHAAEDRSLVKEAARIFGSQSIVVSIDVKRKRDNGYQVFTCCGTRPLSLCPVELAAQMEELGCGEIFINSIDRDGTMQGYDIELIKSITANLRIPVIACGGAGSMEHFADAVVRGGASAVAAGSFFVYNGPLKAVLISYPSRWELESVFK